MILIISAFFYWLKNYAHNSLFGANITTVVSQQSKPQTPSTQEIESNKASITSKNDCDLFKQPYLNLEKLRSDKKLNSRFENIHKRIDNKVYRLRRFFKDGDEGEIETYLTYVEDKDETARVVEKSSYKKGDFFKEIESAKGQIIYHEEGLNVSDNLFLHYINNELKGMQGVFETKNVDCRF